MKQAQTRRAGIKLFTPLEQGLVSDADAQERPPSLDELASGFQQFLPSERVDTIIERPNAGQYHGIGGLQFLPMLDDSDRGTDFLKRIVDASQVAGAVVDQRDHPESVLGTVSGANPEPNSRLGVRD